ncbi:MAG: HDOD domain-containing protein [Desulfobacterales bacterium]|nr:HDOD domain-containing protein [Desulfobacterales bacterium]
MHQSRSLIDLIQEKLNDDRTVLPVFDRTGFKIQQEVAGPDPDVNRIERLITGDQALTSQVLKTANSAFYKGLTKVSTVKSAIVRLGTADISNLVMMATQHKHYTARDPKIKAMMQKLWRHAVGCAIGSQWAARKFGFKDLAREAFTAGLLHDVGKLLLFSVIDSIQRDEDVTIHSDESLLAEIMTNFHTEHGHTLLQNWNLPDSYCTIARDHHLPDFDRNNYLLILVRLVNLTCHKLGLGLVADPDIVLAATPEADQLGISEVPLARLEIKLEDSLGLSA